MAGLPSSRAAPSWCTVMCGRECPRSLPLLPTHPPNSTPNPTPSPCSYGPYRGGPTLNPKQTHPTPILTLQLRPLPRRPGPRAQGRADRHVGRQDHHLCAGGAAGPGRAVCEPRAGRVRGYDCRRVRAVSCTSRRAMLSWANLGVGCSAAWEAYGGRSVGSARSVLIVVVWCAWAVCVCGGCMMDVGMRRCGHTPLLHNWPH